MFSRSEIMKAAHAMYRDFRRDYGAWQIAAAPAIYSMSACLKRAWARAKEAAARKVREVKIAANPAAQRIADEIENVHYLPFGVNAAARRRELEAQLDRLLAA